MGDRDNETGKRPRRSLLSFASQPETAGEASPHAGFIEPDRSPRRVEDLEHYQRMRALRLAASSEITQPPAIEPEHTFKDEEAEQDAVNRMRADMAAIKAELNRRIDDNPSTEPVPPAAPAQTAVLQNEAPAEPAPTVVSVAKPVRRIENDSDEWKPLVDPRIVLTRIVNSKKLIIATTLIGALLGAGYAMTVPKLYYSNVELLVDPRDLKLTDKEIAPGQLPIDASLAIAESQLRIIQSSSVLSKVIDRAGLAKDPEFNGDLKDKGIFAALRELFSTDSTPDATARETLLLRNLNEHMDVARSSKNFIFNITVNSRDPEKSAFIANTVSDVFREEQGNIQSDSARQATDSLTARLNDMRLGVESAENAVQKYKAENDLVDVQGRLISDDEVSRTSDELTAARNQTIKLNAQAASIRGTSVEGVLGNNTLPEEFRSGVIVALRSQYGALKQQADGLATKLGPRHPQLIQAQTQVDGIRKEIRNELDRIASSVQVELKRSVQQEQDLASRLAQLKSRMAGTNENMIKLRELEREVTAKRAVYEAFMLRAKETGELEGINSTNIRVISPARPALESTGGSRKIIVIGGILAGLLAGLGIAMLRGMIDSFRSNGELKTARAENDAPFDPDSPSGAKRSLRSEADTPAPASESRLGAAIKQAQTRSYAPDFDEISDGDETTPDEDQVAVAQFLYEYADLQVAKRQHANSNIEDMLADIAEIRDVLRQRSGGE
ncbi:GumC family protein [Phyllobacterium meliloti]|uniref:GumC family protein n=1 Tax=Phyllobacterium meliloti TaxID=555317 RepID=UPI001D1518C9|nr:GumC family protein [Phyllobacterium sp. T1293]UGX85138.1 GumC family protein [Phyllobacterium sp. T1293]